MKGLSVFSLSIALGLLLSSLPASAEVQTYEIDTEHSSVSFKIRHLVSKTRGDFKKFSGNIEYDKKNPKKSRVTAVIDVASLDTGVEKRDAHLLKDPDFFHVSKYPEMKFETTKVTKVKKKGKKAEILGNLTLHGVTKPVILDVVLTGETTNPFSGQPVIGFTASTTIDRTQWGVTWNHEEDGEAILGKEVEITLEVEAVNKGNKDQKVSAKN